MHGSVVFKQQQQQKSNNNYRTKYRFTPKLLFSKKMRNDQLLILTILTLSKINTVHKLKVCTSDVNAYSAFPRS